jgi:hypothetical protein
LAIFARLAMSQLLIKVKFQTAARKIRPNP